MRVIRRALIAAAGAAGIAAVYTLGAVVHGGPKAEPPVVVAEPLVKMPDVVAPPVLGPEVNLADPSGVLLGKVKVPDDLLRPPEPPARPDLIVPDLGKK